MIKDPVLSGALRLAKKKKYDAAITLLESEIVRYRNSFRFYYLLSLCCLFAGDYGRAYTYLRSAGEIKNKDVNVILGIAAINVKREESGRAVDLYLKALEIDAKNKTAKLALSVLRKYSGSDKLLDWIISGGIKKIFPPFPKEAISVIKIIKIIISGLVGIGIIFILFIAALKTNIISIPALEKEERTGFISSALDSGEKKDALTLDGSYETILTEKQVLAFYERARNYFNNYDDNNARIEINRIMRSNASAPIKNKTGILLHYIDENKIGFDTLKTNFSYADVSKTPPLYAGCYVIWSGVAANISAEASSTSFDFLIGYENRSNITGIVRVRCPFAATLSSEIPLELLGRIVPDSGALGARGFTLEGITLHQSVR
jgi:tetratricopeptide (TPR) repeat protein